MASACIAQRVLVQAGAGGVGTFAIQLAMHLIVERTYPLERISEADRAIETGRTRGKIVMDLTLS